MDHYCVVAYPFDTSKPFENYSFQEMQDVFTWLMNIRESRTQYLREKCAAHFDMDINQLDFTINSFLFIWRYLHAIAAFEELQPDTDYAGIYVSPRLQKKGITAAQIFPLSKQRLSVHTRCMLIDVALYLGDTMIHEHPGLSWGMNTENGITMRELNFGKPVIKGFVGMYNPNYRPVFDPYAICRNRTNYFGKKVSPEYIEELLLKDYNTACKEAP